MKTEFQITGLMENRTHAIVIGGSIAGLLAARVLSDYYDLVTVIEETLQHSDIAQLNPVPTLVTKAYQFLDEIFPNIGYELTTRGAIGIDWAREFQVYSSAGWGRNSSSPSKVISLLCTRNFLTSTIKDLLRKSCCNIKFTNISLIEKFVLEDREVTGIIFRQDDGTEQKIDSRLIIDASDVSLTAQLLQKANLPVPPETIVEPGLYCAVQKYKISSSFPSNLKSMLIRPFPPRLTKIGGLTRIEGNEFITVLGEYGSDLSSINEERFLELAKALPTPKLYEIINAAEPTSEIIVGKANPNHLYHYEKINLPKNLVVLGNAVCLLSPFYAQDTTINILSVQLLQTFLKEQTSFDNFAQSLYNLLLPFWSLATNLDADFPSTEKRTTLPINHSNEKGSGILGNFISWYAKRFLAKTVEDASLYTLWLEVIHQLKPPTEFLAPSVILKVLT